MKNPEDNIQQIIKENSKELPIFFKKIKVKNISNSDNTYLKSIEINKYGTKRVAISSFYKLPTRIL